MGIGNKGLETSSGFGSFSLLVCLFVCCFRGRCREARAEGESVQVAVKQEEGYPGSRNWRPTSLWRSSNRFQTIDSKSKIGKNCIGLEQLTGKSI